MKYRLMGQDGFDYEDYTCGEYDTLREAEKAMREHEEDAEQRGAGKGSIIRDKYWIEHESHCKHCDATFFGTAEMIQHGLRKHHDIMKELGYSEKQLIYD